MLFFYLLEIALAIIFAVLVTTQVILPLATSAPLFPLWRPKPRALDRALESINEDISIAELERRISHARAHAAAIRKSAQSDSENK